MTMTDPKPVVEEVEPVDMDAESKSTETLEDAEIEEEEVDDDDSEDDDDIEEVDEA
jgi:hypothetical protein